MKVFELRAESWVPKPLAATFDFFSKAENLQELTPPWVHFQILSPLPIEMKPGAIIEYKLRVHGIPIRWRTEIERWNPPYEFSDVQKRGPYQLWHHTHRFSEARGGTLIEDYVRYALPFGVLGQLANALQVSKDVRQIFTYRDQRVRELLG